MSKPNFFIVGAPKCGTTAMSEYLRSHSNIFVSEPKEPYYFCDDFNYYFDKENWNLKHYENLFKNVDTKKHIAIGEASVWYLYSKNAISNIIKYNAESKIIVMIRNPVDLVHSLHSQLLYMLDEEEKDFSMAWEIQRERANGRCIPSNTREQKFLMYGDVGKIGEQLERVYSLVPKKQILVINFDDFKKDTKKEYQKVLQFLEVPIDNKSEFPIINENKDHILGPIATFTQRPPKLLLKSAKSFKKLFKIDRLNIRPWIRKINTKVNKRNPIDAQTKMLMKKYFYNDLKKVNELTGIDIKKWL